MHHPRLELPRNLQLLQHDLAMPRNTTGLWLLGENLSSHWKRDTALQCHGLWLQLDQRYTHLKLHKCDATPHQRNQLVHSWKLAAKDNDSVDLGFQQRSDDRVLPTWKQHLRLSTTRRAHVWTCWCGDTCRYWKELQTNPAKQLYATNEPGCARTSRQRRWKHQQRRSHGRSRPLHKLLLQYSLGSYGRSLSVASV